MGNQSYAMWFSCGSSGSVSGSGSIGGVGAGAHRNHSWIYRETGMILFPVVVLCFFSVSNRELVVCCLLHVHVHAACCICHKYTASQLYTIE